MHTPGIGSEELSRCLFNESNDAFFIVDPVTLIVTSVNPTARRLTGLAERELIGRSVEEVILGQKDGDITQLLSGCRETMFIHARDGYQIRGRRGLIDISVSQSRLHGEETVWSLVVVRDITDQKKNERSLVQSKRVLEETLTDLQQFQEELINQERVRAIGELASGVAHDLNNLLVPAVLYSELALEDREIPAETREHLELIARSVRESAAVIARLQQDMADDNRDFQAVPVRELIEHCRILSRPHWDSERQLDGGRIEFSVTVQEDVSDVLGNRTDLQRVLVNLVVNATQSMPDGGRIDVSARQLADMIEIVVADGGVGMNSDQKSRALDLFYTTRTGGTGLGLNLSHRIMEKHGGRISIESQVNRGTKVRILIPVVIREPEKTSNSSTETGIRPLSVLYIDDDEFVRKSITALLRILGAEVESAPDGRSGMQMFDSGMYDVVLTDLGMDEVTGWDVIREIRQRRAAVPVCLISGWSQEEIKRRKKSGCTPDFVLTKPVTRDNLASFLSAMNTDVIQEG